MPAQTRHVWVQTSRHHEPPAAGLLIAWQRHGSTWWAWVVTVIAEPGKSPTVVQHWYHEKDVRPIRTRPISPDPNRWHRGLYADEHGSRPPS
jgi:hypothetical protein